MANPHMNVDTDSDSDDEHIPAIGGGGAVNLGQILLHLAGGHAVHRARGGSNEELVQQMRRNGTITSDKVFRAMTTCPRGHFVPRRHRDESYVDMPIRVDQFGFNISAPHMHATALEALDIKPGDRVLDVGCGCGVWTAYAAFLAGPTGEVVGVDIRDACITMSKDAIAALTESSSIFSSTACPVTFEQHNIFMPAARHRGRYTKVHVGATCPEARLPQLLALLAPEGGSIMAPVGSDLRLVTRSLTGKITHKILSQVRFQDLEVPTDAQVVLATLQDEQQQAAQVVVPPSTLEKDLAAAGLAAPSGSIGRTSMDSSGTAADEPAGPEDSADMDIVDAATPKAADTYDVPTTTTTDKAPAGELDTQGPGRDQVEAAGSSSAAKAAAEALGLGPPDAWLVGSGWGLAVHRQLLCARCELLRAKWCSGMRDSGDGEVQVPDMFQRPAVQALVEYVYSDQLAKGLEPDKVLDVLHVASYYGAGRLLVLCEAALAAELSSAAEEDPEEAAELAPTLLAVADEQGLQQLRGAALAYCVEHYADVSASRAWCHLGPGQVGLVAREAAGQLKRVKALLSELSENSSVTLPSPRWF